MKKATLLFGLSYLMLTSAQAAITDNNADVVYLQKNCQNQSNCDTTMEALLNWTWNTRKPNKASPLLINIGPGDFGRFHCDGDPANPSGYLTVRGSGPETTRLVSQPGQGDLLHSNGCTDMTFENLSVIMNHSDGATSYAIRWLEGGNSVWNNVLVENNNTSFVFRQGAWYDSGCVNGGTGEQGIHLWFASKFKVKARSGINTFGYSNQCPSESRFFGTEIEVIADAQTTQAVSKIAGVELSNAVNNFYGTAIRVYVDTDNPSNQTFGLFAAVSPHFFSGEGGVLHMHGGVITANAEASTAPQAVKGVFGLQKNHTSGVAYVVRASQGQEALRITSEAQSPQFWPPGSDTPDITSITGADMFIENDCDANGNCEGNGNQAHLMIYNDIECPESKWFNTRTNSCRP